MRQRLFQGHFNHDSTSVSTREGRHHSRSARGVTSFAAFNLAIQRHNNRNAGIRTASIVVLFENDHSGKRAVEVIRGCSARDPCLRG
jgi:hypothetical protein